MLTDKVVTRFAPSPTGYLHIGGARTALFNWAFARRHGGRFILRIEDTDVARSTSESARRIVEDLQWLGLDWDEGPDAAAADLYAPATQKGARGPYYQSQRGGLYREFLERLRAAGRAYRCFKTPEQLKAEREAARAQKRPEKYDPAEALGRSEAQQQELIAQGRAFVWRFRMPESDVTVQDLVLGDVTIKREELEDFVIMKSEAAGGGGPTFHFANVVDDATMAVTHVLRAQEHLMNTPKHVAMFDALGLPRPAYAHMPLIFNPDGTKMSKRDKAKTARAAAQDFIKKSGAKPEALWEKLLDRFGPAGLEARGVARADVDALVAKKSDEARVASVIAAALGVALPEIDVKDFRDSGYLRDVLLNYVSLLGWSPKGDVERFDLDFLRERFDFSGIGKANARFDRAKLLSFNADALAKMVPQAFAERLEAHLLLRTEAGSALRARLAREAGGGQPRPQMRWFAAAYQLRARTLDEPLKAAAWLEIDDAAARPLDAKAAKVLDGDDRRGAKLLADVLPVLEAVQPWEPPAIHDALQAFADRAGRPIGDLAQPLRVAITGTTVSPPIDLSLAILGQASTLARIRATLAAAR